LTARSSSILEHLEHVGIKPSEILIVTLWIDCSVSVRAF